MATVDRRPALDPTESVAQALARLLELPPWLSAIADGARVRASLEQHVRGFASGTPRLVACAVDRIRLKRGQDGWNVRYRLTLERDGAEAEELPVVGRLIPPNMPAANTEATPGSIDDADWQCYLPDLRVQLQRQAEDQALPALALLSNGETARELLQAAIRDQSPAYANIAIAGCSIKALRYKPGSRCTVVYQVSYAPGEPETHDWPSVVVAKTYHGDKGQNAYDAMRALWNSTLRDGGTATLAEPLAYLPELRVLIQGPIAEERTLEELLKTAFREPTPAVQSELENFMRTTAVALAALHRSGVDYGEQHTWNDELADMRALLQRLAVPLPGIADAPTPLLERLERAAAEAPPDPAGPAHHAFRPAQVLIAGNDIGLIDFDGFCQAEPGLDLALFLRKTRALALTAAGCRTAADVSPELLSRVDDLCELFVAEYERHAVVSRRRIALWEALDLLTLLLFCWTKVEPARLPMNMFLLQHHLRRNDLW